MFLGFFIILAILAPLLAFLFGRIMVIETFISVRATDLPLSCIPHFRTEPKQGVPRSFARWRRIRG